MFKAKRNTGFCCMLHNLNLEPNKHRNKTNMFFQDFFTNETISNVNKMGRSNAQLKQIILPLINTLDVVLKK